MTIGEVKRPEHWYLYWEVGLEHIQELIRYHQLFGHKNYVEFYCRVFVMIKYGVR